MNMQAIRLKTEHLTNPLGVDFTAPCLYWNCAGGKTQTAYRITAADDAAHSLWDSGKVPSSAMRAAWGGAPLPAQTRVQWTVQLWDENDIPGEPETAFFETGLDRWQASWITGHYTPNKKQR